MEEAAKIKTRDDKSGEQRCQCAYAKTRGGEGRRGVQINDALREKPQKAKI